MASEIPAPATPPSMGLPQQQHSSSKERPSQVREPARDRHGSAMSSGTMSRGPRSKVASPDGEHIFGAVLGPNGPEQPIILPAKSGHVGQASEAPAPDETEGEDIMMDEEPPSSMGGVGAGDGELPAAADGERPAAPSAISDEDRQMFKELFASDDEDKVVWPKYDFNRKPQLIEGLKPRPRMTVTCGIAHGWCTGIFITQ